MSAAVTQWDSYQGAQVGATKAITGRTSMCRQVNALGAGAVSDWHFLLRPDRKRQRDVETKLWPTTKPKQRQLLLLESCPHFVNAFGSGLSVIRGRVRASEGEVTEASGPVCLCSQKGKGGV